MKKENQIEKINKKNNTLLLEVGYKLDFLVKGQERDSNKLEIVGNDLRKGFIGLALRNEELLKSNDQLKEQLDDVLKELNVIKQEREEKTRRREKWAKRKRLPKRDPMTANIYTELMRAAEGPTYIQLRTRIALCILSVTGIRINELLSLKVSQLETLFKENWIAIDRSKRGPSNHKAFLTKEGKKIIQERQKDFQLLFLMKEPNSYIFTAEANHFKQLDRVAITRDVNIPQLTAQNFTNIEFLVPNSNRLIIC